MTSCLAWSLLAMAMTPLAPASEDESRMLFDFQAPDAARSWATVNDGVMGGRSEGRFRIDSGRLEFFGELSLANNGGFASVRSRPQPLGLRTGDAIVLRVKGDGRTYSFNLYEPTARTAFSYRVEFRSQKDKWIEVTLPLSAFRATWFGRALADARLDPGRINSVGLLLGDKQAGPFRLEVDSIRVVRQDVE